MVNKAKALDVLHGEAERLGLFDGLLPATVQAALAAGWTVHGEEFETPTPDMRRVEGLLTMARSLGNVYGITLQFPVTITRTFSPCWSNQVEPLKPGIVDGAELTRCFRALRAIRRSLSA